MACTFSPIENKTPRLNVAGARVCFFVLFFTCVASLLPLCLSLGATACVLMGDRRGEGVWKELAPASAQLQLRFDLFVCLFVCWFGFGRATFSPCMWTASSQKICLGSGECGAVRPLRRDSCPVAYGGFTCLFRYQRYLGTVRFPCRCKQGQPGVMYCVLPSF